MSKYLDKLVRAVKREPVRVRMYAIAAAVFGLLAYFGKIDPTDVEAILGAVATVLAVERSRAHTVPAVKGSRRRR